MNHDTFEPERWSLHDLLPATNGSELEEILASLEEAVCEIPYINDCAAFGVPNSLLGQAVGVRVYTFLKDTIERRSMIRAHMKGKYPKAAIPTRVEISQEPLMSSRMKKLRR